MGKSDQIRQVIRERPGITPKEIQEHLAGQGIDVSRNLCKVVRHRELRGKKTKRRSSERLRFGERRTSFAGVVRISDEELVIWNRLKDHVASLEDPSDAIHNYGDWTFKQLPFIRDWIKAVSTRSARKRRRAIVEQFIDDLCGCYPPPNRFSRIQESGRTLRLEHPPFEPCAPESIFEGHQSRRWIDEDRIEEEASNVIRQDVKAITERFDSMLDLFHDLETVHHLLSLDNWHRHHSLSGIANGYPILSTLDDLLELAWSFSKVDNLPKVLKALHGFNPVDGAIGEWQSNPDAPQLLFLLALWINKRIKVSSSKEDSGSRVQIGKLM